MPPAIIPLARFGLPVANPYNWRFHVQGSDRDEYAYPN